MATPQSSQETTTQAKTRKCPLCFISYANLSRHIKDVHGVTDRERRKLLIGRQSYRYSGSLKCPVQGCTNVDYARLDKHLQGLHKLKGQRLKEVLQQAKKMAIKKELQKTPQPRQEEGPVHAGEEAAPDIELKTLLFETVKKVAKLTKEVKRLRGEVQGLKTPAIHILNSSQSKEQQPEDSCRGQLMKSFLVSLSGPNPSRKYRENCKQQVAHVKNWVDFMWDKPGDVNTSLLFLHDLGRLQEWLDSLGQRGLTPSSQRYYILDIQKFLGFLRNAGFPRMRLAGRTIQALQVKLKAWNKGLSAAIVIQRQETRSVKTVNLIPSQALLEFYTRASSLLPGALNDLQADPGCPQNLRVCVGLLVGIMAVSTGHRKGVFSNMTPKDVRDARRHGNTAIISVSSHKTAAAFGKAKLPLSIQDWNALKGFLEISKSLPGSERRPKTVFFDQAGKEMTRIGLHFTAVWTHLQLPGEPTLTDVRTAISTYTDKALNPKDRERIASAMCRDVQTAKRFYVPEATAEEAAANRQCILKALLWDARGGEAAAQEKATSEGESEPQPSTSTGGSTARAQGGSVEDPFQEQGEEDNGSSTSASLSSNGGEGGGVPRTSPATSSNSEESSTDTSSSSSQESDTTSSTE
ncbi:hypothetical protein MATL_G00093020 [Megalops atlanticus]|uniref:Uncharacterized protein n=1 Tax=Megalops atlanticus TaxID=7932 RepID=A0A9D3Q1C1_MEGAT|nr:hypothetical protein MATL_G00093020 [Megalops atlanticus]